MVLIYTSAEISTVHKDFFKEQQEFFTLFPKPAWFKMVVANELSTVVISLYNIYIKVGDEVLLGCVGLLFVFLSFVVISLKTTMLVFVISMVSLVQQIKDKMHDDR